MASFWAKAALTATVSGFSLIAAGTIAASPALAQQAERLELNTPAGSLSQALLAVSNAFGVPVIASDALVAGRQAPSLTGLLTVEEALAQVLAGTGLEAEASEGGPFVIVEVASPDDAQLLPALVVTARRTEEAFQEVPASIFVLDGQQVERSNIEDADDLSLLTPNLDFSGNDNPGRIFFSIRGISDLNAIANGPTIGFFQDGVLQNNTGPVFTVNRRLVDVERVEVIYGPQGTAFGRGTVGGAINVVTKKPTDVLEASLLTEFGGDFNFSSEAMLNVPITDKLALRTVLYGGLSEGFVDAPFSGTTDMLSDDNIGGRASVRFTPTDRLTIDGTVQFDRTRADAPIFSIESSVLDGDPLTLAGTIDQLETERLNLLGEVAYDLDFARLISRTAFNRSTFQGDEDFDISPPVNSIITRDQLERSFSQEVRLESKEFVLPENMGSVSTNLGFIYNDIATRLNTPFASGLGSPATSGLTVSENDIDITNIGLFGDVRYRPIDELELTVGARISRDKVSVDTSFIGSGALSFLGVSTLVEESSFFSITPNASILYDWSENLATYVSYSTGFRPGGFAGTLAGPVIEYDEEFAQNFEVGMNSSWLNGRLVVNSSAFVLLYDDIQVPIGAEFGGGIENAASARSIGGELTIAGQPLPGLSLQGGVGVAVTKFTDFAQSVSGDQTGERLPRAPRFSLSMIGDYEHSQPLIFNARPFARVEYSYRSDYSAGVGSAATLGGFDVTNLRLGLRRDDFELTFFVENIFDEDYFTEAFFTSPGVGFSPPPEFEGERTVVPGAGRHFGVLASIKF
ncbi:MAG: TonB-dependent receptor [Pseudomonadota bacterium]